VAIEHGLQVLSWFENLQKDEVPPEHLWEDAEGLEQWWADVEAKREDGVETKRGSGAASSESDEDPGRQMVENDYARFLKNG